MSLWRVLGVLFIINTDRDFALATAAILAMARVRQTPASVFDQHYPLLRGRAIGSLRDLGDVITPPWSECHLRTNCGETKFRLT